MKQARTLEEWADGIFLSDSAFSKRKTFSCPSYYINGKMVAFLFENGLGLKLHPMRVEELVRQHKHTFHFFEPMGSIMKNWVVIHRKAPQEYEQDRHLIQESLAFVLHSPVQPGKRRKA